MKFIYIFFLVLRFAFLYGQKVNPLPNSISNGALRVTTRLFAQIPRYRGSPSRINHITFEGDNIYVSTETSGGLVYKVTPTGGVSLFANINELVRAKTGRPIDFSNIVHGGLRSIAFHPSFRQTGLFYASFMERRPARDRPNNIRYVFDRNVRAIADSVVAEFRYNFQDKKVNRLSYRQVIRVGVPKYDHPIKDITFGGNLLYIAHGDGSVQSATAGGGQKNDPLGKILRINPLRSGNRPYSIPASNPFVNNPRYMNEIWALGFRNPHNICFSSRGELFVTDVGRDNVEEVNVLSRGGGDYGWSKREGTFVHLEQPGVLTGIRPLPANDAQNNFIYPNVQVGHEALRGKRFIGQALAGSCPVENGSPNSGVFFYTNFPRSGELYYSNLNTMRAARVKGPPNTLTQARTFRANILFDHDRLPFTPPRMYRTLGDLLRRESGISNDDKANIRMGRGRRGELYWSSKSTGQIFIITSTVPRGGRRNSS